MHQYFMKSAVHQIPLQIIYESKQGIFSKRVIFVKKINKDYIFAYCFTKKQYRKFSVDRILAVFPYEQKGGFETA